MIYEERLKECGLTTLETRILRGDQIEVFTILNGYDNIDYNLFFEIKESKITSTKYKTYSMSSIKRFSQFSPQRIP